MIHGREGTTQLLALKFDGEAGGGRRMAIIRDLQFHPVTEHLLHVDLQEVSADRTITVRVAVRPVGEPAGVKEQKGILNIVVHELEVSCLPTAIPERIHRSEEHTSELQSPYDLVCRLLLEKKKEHQRAPVLRLNPVD